MTLLMRDQENIEKGREEGREEGIAAMVENALRKSGSITKTVDFLNVNEEKVRKIALSKGIPVND